MEEIDRTMWLEFEKSRSGELRNTIIMHYVRLVKEIAMRIAPNYKNYVEFDDLYSNGIFGLMDAIEKYDVNKGIKFSTYATWRIRGAMIDQIRSQDWLPKSMRLKFKKLEEAYSTLEKKIGRFPTEEEIANYLKTSIKEVQKILSESYYYQIISIDEQIMDIAGYDSQSDLQAPQECYIKKEFKEKLANSIDKLTENEKTVTSLYYFNELNQKEIAKVMGLTESRVSQLHSKALIKLRAELSDYVFIEN